MTSSDFADPNKKYLGKNNSENRWGYGLPNRFDNVLINTESSEFCNHPIFTSAHKIVEERHKFVIEVDSKKYEMYTLYQNTTVHKSVDLRPYLNREEFVKGLKSSEERAIKLVNHCRLNLNITMKRDKDSLLNNLDSSLLYKVVREWSEIEEFMRDPVQEDSLIETMLDYKEQHKDFGFLSRDELFELAREERESPLPIPLLKILKKKGLKGLTKNQLDYINQRSAALNSENWIHVYEDLKGLVGQGTSAQQLITYGMKDKEIFGTFNYSCNSEEAIKYLNTLMNSIFDLLENGDIRSQVLDSIAADHKVEKNKFYRSFIGNFFMDLLTCRPTDCRSFPDHKIYKNVLVDFLECDLLKLLDSCNMDLYRTVDFDVDDDVFLDFVDDLLNNISLGKDRFKFGKTDFRLNDPAVVKYLSSFTKTLKTCLTKSNHLSKWKPKIVFKSSKKKVCLHDLPFNPGKWFFDHKNKKSVDLRIDEDSIEDFECDIEMGEFDIDSYDYEEYEEKDLVYIRKTLCGMEDFYSLCGTSKRIIIETSIIPKGCLKLGLRVYENCKCLDHRMFGRYLVTKNVNILTEGYKFSSYNRTLEIENRKKNLTYKLHDGKQTLLSELVYDPELRDISYNKLLDNKKKNKSKKV
jgi:hypothetical protein